MDAVDVGYYWSLWIPLKDVEEWLDVVEYDESLPEHLQIIDQILSVSALYDMEGLMPNHIWWQWFIGAVSGITGLPITQVPQIYYQYVQYCHELV